MVLEELRRQTIAAQIEMLIVTPDRAGVGDTDLEGFCATKWIIVPSVETSGDAMDAAVRGASAPFVVYAEEHSYFAIDWAERLVSAHAAGHDVVGFAIENANPGTLTSWAQLYAQFGPLVAPVESGESSFLGGHHVSYRRSLLLEYGDRLAVMLEDEAALFLDLRARRIPMHIAGGAVSRHVNLSSLRAYMYMDYLGQRSFAATRATQSGWGWPRRVAWSAAAPIIPLLRMSRSIRDIRRTGRSRSLLPRILGPMALGLIAGGVGEFMGYMFGPGRAAEHRTPAELQRKDFLAKGECILHESAAPSTT
jgi:hypothetical protein